MNAAQKTPSLFSILKDKPQLAWVGGIFLAIYLVYVIFFFRLTASAIISLLIAILVFLAVSLFWYYLAYRWAAPELTRTKFHQNLMLWLSSAMLGTAFSIWFIQNENIPTQVLQFLNRFLPYSILEGKPVAEYQAYFPLITWICITGVLTIVIRVFLAVLSWKQPGSTLLSKRIRMILLIAYAVSLFSVTACIFSTDFLEIGPGQPSIIF